MFTGPTVTLAPRSARPLWLGHPWVWERSIADVDRPPRPGQVVRVVDEHGQTVDFAWWSPRSAIRARTLRIGPDWPADWPADELPDDWLASRLAAARDLRARHGLPSPDTDAWRWVNSEGDGLPGVVVDVYGTTAVLHLTTLAAWEHRDALIAAMRSCGTLDRVFVQTDAGMRDKEGLPELAETAFGEPLDPGRGALATVERGVRYRVELGLQKTGHFCDQRDHRAAFGRLAEGRRVLDAFCYTGGFGLQAALHGAAEVIGVDSSAAAVELAAANAEANGVTEATTWRRRKAEDELRAAFDRGERFGLIGLDPPKWAPSARDRDKALRKLESLCVEALRVLEPGGHLVVSSCSHALGADELLTALAGASGRTHRRVDVDAIGGQPPDHPYPAAMREGRYLTVVYAHA